MPQDTCRHDFHASAVQLKGAYALGRDNSLVMTEFEFAITEDILIKSENIFFDSFKLLACQKGSFIKPILDLEPRQGMKQEWNAACHILDEATVLTGEIRGMVLEPAFCLILRNIRPDGLKKCVDIPATFLH